MRWLACLFVCATGCSSLGLESESCPASAGGNCDTQGLSCTYGSGARAEVCTCDGHAYRCSTCGDLGRCSPGDSCSFSDWERDCDCGCTAHGYWQCTGFYQNYGCPTDETWQDAGVDAP